MSLLLSDFSLLVLSLFYLLFALSSLCLLLTAFLSVFFLIRDTCHCCTDCASVTTQSDITDNNKPFPKITSDTRSSAVTFSSQFVCLWKPYDCNLCDFFCKCAYLWQGHSFWLQTETVADFQAGKKALQLPQCCSAITLADDMSVLWHLTCPGRCMNIYTAVPKM